MVATKDIRNRLQAILDTITAVTGTKVTVETRLTGAAVDYQGFIWRVLQRTGTPQKQSGYIKEAHVWVIELHSTPYGIGNEAQKQDAMYDYYDELVQKFAQNPTLPLSGASLGDGVKAVPGTATYTWGDTSLDGVNIRYKLSFVLNLEKRTPCESV